MKLKDINKKEFEDFCKTQKCDNFFQSKYYAEIKRLEGYHTYFVGLEDNGKILGATLLLSKEVVLFKKREFYAPRGIIIDYNNINLVKEFTTQLVEYVKNKKGAFIKINPIIPLNEDTLVQQLKDLGWNQGNIELQYPKEESLIYTIDLKNKDYDKIIESFSTDTQQLISKNKEIGISTRKLDNENLWKLIDIINNSTYVSDHLSIDYSNYQEISKILTNHNILDITIAELDIDKYKEHIEKSNVNNLNEELEIIKKLQYNYGHKVLIGLILGVTYNNNYYVLTHSLSETIKNLNPLISLYAETIKECCEKKYNSYNLYEIGNTIENNTTLEDINGFNGELIQLIGEFNYIIDEKYYKKSIKKQKKTYLNEMHPL